MIICPAHVMEIFDLVKKSEKVKPITISEAMEYQAKPDFPGNMFGVCPMVTAQVIIWKGASLWYSDVGRDMNAQECPLCVMIEHCPCGKGDECGLLLVPAKAVREAERVILDRMAQEMDKVTSAARDRPETLH